MKVRKLLSALVAGLMLLGTMNVPAFADGTDVTMTFEEFVSAIETVGSVGADDHRTTVTWRPVSGCGYTNHKVDGKCPDGYENATASTPEKINSHLAQFQFGRNAANIEIKNVDFKYVATDFSFCHQDRSTQATGNKTVNDAPTAQLHLYNTGSVTVSDCTFDNVVLTPWNYDKKAEADRTIAIDGCTFKNIADSYGIKDVQASNISITDNTFTDTRSGIMLSEATAGSVTISGNTFTCDEQNGDLIQIATTFLFNDTSDMSVTGNTSNNNTGVFRIMHKAVQNITVSGNKIPEGASYTSGNSKYEAEIAENGSLTAKGWDGPEGTTVEYNGNYYATLQEALKAVYKSSPAGVAIINCKEGAEVGQLSHGHVADNLIINGNGAKIVPGGDQDIEVDTYKYSRTTGDLDATSGVYLDKDISITVNNLGGIAVWGQRNTDYTVNITLNNCINVNRVYISGTAGTNNITLNNCSFDGKSGSSNPNTSVYSNNPGTINVTDCTFKDIQLALNFNNKTTGKQTINVKNCTVTDCAIRNTWTDFSAPLRFVTSNEKATSNVTLTDVAISYSEGKTNIGNGDILLGEGRENEKSFSGITLRTSGVDAEVQMQFPGEESMTVKKDIKADESATLALPKVAKIGDKTFGTLAGAFAAVQSGDTVTLLQDVTLDKQINILNALDNLTFDGNGHTITTHLTDQSVLYFGNNTLSKWVNGVKIKDLTMRGSARFGIFLCGGTSSELTNVDIQGDYYIGINLYGTHGATLTNCTVNTTREATDGYVGAIWSNVAAQNPLKLVNSKVGVININTYTTANTLAPKIIVDADSEATIHTFDDGSVSKTRLMCLSAQSEGKVTVQQYDSNGNPVSGILVPVASVGDIYYESMAEAEEASVATGLPVVPYKVAEQVNVLFEKAASENDDEAVYDIYIEAADQIINRLNSAEFAFELTTQDDITYAVAGTDKVNVKEENGKYLFNFDGKTAADESGTKIKIGQVKFVGYGTFSFEITGDKNIVNATTTQDNIVTSYVANPTAANEGTLDVSNQLTDVTIQKPVQKLTVNVAFNNAIKDNAAAYQDMTVTVNGSDLAAPIVTKLGTGVAFDATHSVYTVTIADQLTKNYAYTVTVEGAGYRTARYTVTMTADKTLNFWNNVKDTVIAIEEGNTTASKVTKNFLAGDIVKDGKINIYDLSAVVSYFGTTNATGAVSPNAKYDLNRDGVIDSKDVAYVLVSWGE